MASGPFRWLLALAMPLMKKFATAQAGRKRPLDRACAGSGPFGVVVAPLAGLPAGSVMKAALDGAFEPGLLSRSAKALMFAVVARTLGCPHCEAAAHPTAARRGPEPRRKSKAPWRRFAVPAWRNAKPASWPGRATRCTTNLRRSSKRHAPSAPNWAPMRCWKPSAWHRWRTGPSGWPCCWSDGAGLGPCRARGHRPFRPGGARAARPPPERPAREAAAGLR